MYQTYNIDPFMAYNRRLTTDFLMTIANETKEISLA
jgi:hypothetical protein